MSIVGATASFIKSPLGVVLITGVGLLAAWPVIKGYLKGVGSQAPAANPPTSSTSQGGTCNAQYTPVCSCSAFGQSGYACCCSCVTGCLWDSCDPLVAGTIYASRLRRPNTSNSAGGIPASNITQERSSAIQSWSKKPFQAGPTGCYASAYNSSPPDPKYTANILTVKPRVKIKGT